MNHNRILTGDCLQILAGIEDHSIDVMKCLRAWLDGKPYRSGKTYAGSGTTGEAAIMEGFQPILIEQLDLFSEIEPLTNVAM